MILCIVIIFFIILLILFIFGFKIILNTNYKNVDRIIKIFEDNQTKERDMQNKYLQDLIVKTGDIFKQLDKLIIDIDSINHTRCIIYDEYTQSVVEKQKIQCKNK